VVHRRRARRRAAHRDRAGGDQLAARHRARRCLLTLRLVTAALLAAGCNTLLGNHDFHTAGDGGTGTPPDADPCAVQMLPSTTVSGTVFAPDGKLPIYNAAVYIPTTALSPITSGVGPATCASGTPPLVVHTDTSGHFKLGHIPANASALVMQVGKWRRMVPLPAITSCADNPIDVTTTRLPRISSEGDMPQIAVTTGAADSFECLLLAAGIDPSEFVVGPSAAGHIHLYQENGASLIGSTALPNAATLFTQSALAPYDIVMFSCPGSPSMLATPPNAATMRTWADGGGWLFLMHFGYQWLIQGPTPWATMAQFSMGPIDAGVATVSVDTTPAIGQKMSDWLTAVNASMSAGTFQLVAGTGRNSCSTIDNQIATRRLFLDPALNANTSGVQSFTWENSGGGRVTFDDVHVSGTGGNPGQAFPSECIVGALTAQQKALLFQLFETPTCDPQ
jgi:hypothetical protein